MGKVAIKLEGVGDVIAAFDELAQQIGDRKANSKILIPAARNAMRPVLALAQQLAPVDTGALRLSLQIAARRPNSRDKRSKYINTNDAVIATITTASGKKMRAMSEGKGLKSSKRRLLQLGATQEQADAFQGFESDARAMVQEFGSSKTPAKPYLRPALESRSQETVDILSEQIRKYITKFRAKT